MKLYLLTNPKAAEAGCYVDAVVAARDENDARVVLNDFDSESTPADLNYIDVKYLGDAAIHIERGVITTTFKNSI